MTDVACDEHVCVCVNVREKEKSSQDDLTVENGEKRSCLALVLFSFFLLLLLQTTRDRNAKSKLTHSLAHSLACLLDHSTRATSENALPFESSLIDIEMCVYAD